MVEFSCCGYLAGMGGWALKVIRFLPGLCANVTLVESNFTSSLFLSIKASFL